MDGWRGWPVQQSAARVIYNRTAGEASGVDFRCVSFVRISVKVDGPSLSNS